MLREASSLTGIGNDSLGQLGSPGTWLLGLPLRSGERAALGGAAVDRPLIQRAESRVAAAHLPADETVCICSAQASSHAALLAGRNLLLREAPLHRESRLPRQRIWKLGQVQYISRYPHVPSQIVSPLGTLSDCRIHCAMQPRSGVRRSTSKTSDHLLGS